MKKLLLLILFLIVLSGCSNKITKSFFGSDTFKEKEQITFETKAGPITLGYTDNNTGEDFKIYTDKEGYSDGLLGTEVYFTIINDSVGTNADLYFLFNDDADIKYLYKYEKIIKEKEYPIEKSVEKACKDVKEGVEVLQLDNTTCLVSKITGVSTVEEVTDNWINIPIEKNGVTKEYKKNDKEKYSKGYKKNNKARISIKESKKKKTFGANKQSSPAIASTLYKAFITYGAKKNGEFFIEVMADDDRYSHLDPWYNSNWLYKKKVTINGETGVNENYQVLLKIGESSGIVGADFDVSNHSSDFPTVENDGGDFRFTDSGGTTELDYYVESVTGTAPNRLATVWVKVSDVLTSDVDIYIYYGNSSSPANDSNPRTTFLFFDDFEDNDYTDRWTVSSGLWSESDGKLSGYDTVGVITTPFTTLPDNFEIEYSWQQLYSDYIVAYVYLIDEPTNDYHNMWQNSYTSNQQNDWDFRTSEGNGAILTGKPWNKDKNIHVSKATIDETYTRKWYFDDVLKDTETLNTNYNIDPTIIRLKAYAIQNGETTSWLYMRIRQFVSIEPTFKSVGNEEEEPVEPINSCTYSGTGNWVVLESDNCYITENVYVNGNLKLIGASTGQFGCADDIVVSVENFQYGTNIVTYEEKCIAYH